MAVSLQCLMTQFLSDNDDWRKQLTRDWANIVGGLHTKMRLEKIMHDTVVIGVYELHWMQELFMISSMIMDTMNQKLGGPHVTKLRFVVAGSKNDGTLRKRGSPRHHVRAERKPLAVHQKKVLEAIEDEQLRAALERLWYRCQA